MSKKSSDETVALVAPNGMRVTVAASKVEARLAGGYRQAEQEKPRRARSTENK